MSQARFGEFLAVGGSAAYLPTDGTNVPDFMVSSGELVPEMNVLYGLRCEGGFTHLLRFEASSVDSPISFAEWCALRSKISGAPAIGMVMVVESAGLVGAALRRSPAAAAGVNGAPIQISRGSLLAVVLHGTALLAIAGPDLRSGGRSECRTVGSAASPLGRRSVAAGTLSRRGIFLSSPCRRGASI